MRRTLFVCVASCLLAVSVYPQDARTVSTQPAKSEATRAFAADGLSLVNRIKAVESPTFRAYLYFRTSVWLWKSAGGDEVVRLAAVSAAVAGITDIHEHEDELPPALAGLIYPQLLSVVRQGNPSEAARLEQACPLQLQAKLTEADKAGASLHAALTKLDNTQAGTPQGLEQAAGLVGSGKVPIMTLQGEILRLDQLNSPALPRMLSAALALEERSSGAIPLLNMFFLSHVYLKETTPAELQARFLAATLRATRVSPALSRDPTASSWAVKLLQRALPSMQKLAPSLYAEAAAQLAALAPGVPQQDDVYARIKNSADPLAQATAEAEAADDEQLARDLFRSAAELARRQGKLRLAVDLLVRKDEERRDLPEAYSSYDEFLGGVVEEALKQTDVETARYAASRMRLRVNHADALRNVAHHFIEAADTPRAVEAMGEAVKSLQAAPDGKEKTISFFRLAAEFVDVDVIRASEIAREAVKAANNIPRPREDAGGKFTRLLLPVADNAIKTLQALARRDRSEALSLADAFQPKEFKIAATLGVYSATQP